MGSTGYIYRKSKGKEKLYAVNVTTSKSIPEGLVMLDMRRRVFRGLCLKEPTIAFPIDRCVSMPFIGEGSSLNVKRRKAKLLPDYLCEKKFHSNSTASEFCAVLKNSTAPDEGSVILCRTHESRWNVNGFQARKTKNETVRIHISLPHVHYPS